jgi:hypothetical protein
MPLSRAEAEDELSRFHLRAQAWQTALDACLHRYRCARLLYVAYNCHYLECYDRVGGEDRICAFYKRHALEAGEQMNIERANIRSVIENISAAETAYRIKWEEIRETDRNDG